MYKILELEMISNVEIMKMVMTQYLSDFSE